MMEIPALPVIGEAAPGDLAQLLELYTYLHPKDPPLAIDARVRRIWEAILTDENIHYVVARHEERIISTCTLTLIPNLTRGARPYALIENVVTHPDFRRRGFGTKVLHHALQIAWHRDCFKVMVVVGRQPESTLRFYEQAGFGPADGAATGFIAKPDALSTT